MRWSKEEGHDTTKKNWLLITLLILFFPYSVKAATEVQKIETNGSIGFTGIYKPIGTPDPQPPESIVDPDLGTEISKQGALPQTNDIQLSWPIYLGIILISFVLGIWKRKKKQDNEKKTVGK
ncbi:LPXTG cell wall anchor domain-containing protein [Enterococcus mundtii]